MLKRSTGSVLALLAAVAFLADVRAQTAQQSGAAKAPTARATPDLSGVWAQHPSASARQYAIYTFTKDLPPMTLWGRAQYDAAKPSWGPRAVPDSTDLANPTTGSEVGCFPPGVPRIYIHPFPMEIVQIPGRVIMLFEYDHYVRQIYTDGSQHPKNLSPTWMGDSVGRWEGDTLVVDTVGFNDKTWLDRAGLPHSDALHVVERIRRVNHDTLEVNISIDDPKAYTKLWGGQVTYQLKPGWQLMEMICEDVVSFNELKKEGKEQ